MVGLGSIPRCVDRTAFLVVLLIPIDWSSAFGKSKIVTLSQYSYKSAKLRLRGFAAESALESADSIPDISSLLDIADMILT